MRCGRARSARGERAGPGGTGRARARTWPITSILIPWCSSRLPWGTRISTTPADDGGHARRRSVPGGGAQDAPDTGSMFAKTGCAAALVDSFFFGLTSSLSKVMAMRSFPRPFPTSF